ncbi:MAG: methyl-accepting chemotaxis protein, partial [Thermoanaerobaculia bacterium]
MALQAPSDQSNIRFGLRAKFILAFAIQAIVIALVIILIQQWLVRREMLSQTVEHGRAIATTIESTAGYYVIFGLTDDLQAIAADLSRSTSVDYAEFLSGDGKVLAATKKVRPAEIAQRPLKKEAGGVISDGHFVFTVPFYESRAAAVTPGAKASGYFRLVVNDTLANEAVRSLRGWNVLITIVVLVLAAVLAWIVARFIVRPILTLVEVARRISRGDLTQRTRLDTGDEIGILSEAFDGMAANLEKTVRNLVQSQVKLRSVVETVESRSQTVIQGVDEQRTMIDDTYRSIDQLNSGVRKITDNVEALSASSEETSSSMLEMVASMEEVSRHTDTLFNSVEETASATHQMVTSINEVDKSVVYLNNFVTDTSSSMVEMSASIAQVEGNAARSYDVALSVADAAETGMK